MSNIDLETFLDVKFILHHIKFGVLLLFQIIAIVLSLIILAYFIKHKSFVKNPQNHGILILIAVNFIQLVFDMPNALAFYSRDYIYPNTSNYCTWWTFFAYSIFAISGYLLATISIQRHFFIFNIHILRTGWNRIFLHYFPLVLCIFYPIVFYLFAIVFYPCDGTQWDFTNNLCGFAPCYLLFNKVLGTFDIAVNNYMPVVIDFISNVIIILRVVKQKRHAQRSTAWKQQRHMTIQLLSLSIIYLIAWTPCLTVLAVQMLHDPTFLLTIQTDYFLDLIYIIYLFIPWACIGFIPGVMKWIKGLILQQPFQNTIVPIPTNNVRDNTKPRNGI